LVFKIKSFLAETFLIKLDKIKKKLKYDVN